MSSSDHHFITRTDQKRQISHVGWAVGTSLKPSIKSQMPCSDHSFWSSLSHVFLPAPRGEFWSSTFTDLPVTLWGVSQLQIWKWKESISSSVMSDFLWPPWTIASVCGILQSRILDWIALPFSRGSSWPRSPSFQEDSLLSEPRTWQI